MLNVTKFKLIIVKSHFLSELIYKFTPDLKWLLLFVGYPIWVSQSLSLKD